MFLTLYFVGLGLSGVDGLSLEGYRLLKSCRVVYLERYTNPSAPSSKELGDFLGRDVVEVPREFVEDGRRILSEARDGDVALTCSGDPMVATTHQELRVRAVKEGLETRIIHGVSIVGCISGELGLHQYKFGKMVTATTSKPALNTVLDTVYWNLLRGLHTLLLLEWTPKHALTPNSALKMLKEADEDLRLGVFNDNLFVIVVARISQRNQLVKLGLLREVLDEDYGEPPFSIVIPADLHFTEVEALETLFKCSECSKVNNTLYVKSKANLLVPKYVEKTRATLAKVRRLLDERRGQINMLDLLENVDCYSSDALRFLNEGKPELAILSIGYAEGLLDSLRFLGLVDVPW
ncbi:MAG: diphthine synthase [Nitrososphaerales archaeon]